MKTEYMVYEQTIHVMYTNNDFSLIANRRILSGSENIVKRKLLQGKISKYPKKSWRFRKVQKIMDK